MVKHQIDELRACDDEVAEAIEGDRFACLLPRLVVRWHETHVVKFSDLSAIQSAENKQMYIIMNVGDDDPHFGCVIERETAVRIRTLLGT